MQQFNNNLLLESDEDIKSTFEHVFKLKKIILKDLKIEHKDNATYFQFIFEDKVYFLAKWTESPFTVNYLGVADDKQTEVKTINHPTIYLLIDSIIVEYKKISKRKELIKKTIEIALSA